MAGTFRVARSLRVLSKPVDSTSITKEATQNHTRTVKMAELVKPSVVMAIVKPLMLAAQTDVPEVVKISGNAINAENKVIMAVRSKKCLIGIREVTAKTKGTRQMARR